MDLLFDSQSCSLNPNVFPVDGTHMRTTQIVTLCKLLDLGHPGSVLREVWQEIDGIVAERNAIAHGRQTAVEVGRKYSEREIVDKLDLWEGRWLDFLDWVEAQASQRDFYLLPR